MTAEEANVLEKALCIGRKLKLMNDTDIFIDVSHEQAELYDACFDYERSIRRT